MLTTVRPTPMTNEHHTAALEMRPGVQTPQKRAEERAGESAPRVRHQLRDEHDARVVLQKRDDHRDEDERHQENAHGEKLLFSDMSFTTLPLMRSSVSVEDDVRTSDESVDIDADNTSTMTRPISTSGNVEKAWWG